MAFRLACAINPAPRYFLRNQLLADRAHGVFEHARAEDRKLRKELALEVLALKVPFRNLPVFPNQVPWPGQLSATLVAKSTL